MSWNENNFKQTLEETHQFPCLYTFKFIVNTENIKEVESLVVGAKTGYRFSTNRSYVSVTLTKEMSNSQEVVDVYKKAYQIRNILSL